MFNWTTTTILNSLTDSNGTDLVKVWEDAETAGEGKAGFSGSYPVLKIKRDHTFEKRYITKVYRTVANVPTLCEMTVDCAAIATALNALKTAGELVAPAHLRLSFYVALEGSEESIYANDGYQKGKPFSVGFDVTATELANAKPGLLIAKKIKNNAEKYGVIMYGKKIFELSVDGTTLTIKGTHEYQRFYKAALALDDVLEEAILDSFEMPQEGDTSEGGVFELVKRGENGFGTYNHLLKDLRLPTAQNTRWLALDEDTKPAVGAKYNQYIITYCAPSMANPGFTVVGQHNMSLTTHVFWVNEAIDSAFKTAIDKVATVEDTVVDGALKVKAAADAGKNYAVNHEQDILDIETNPKASN